MFFVFSEFSGLKRQETKCVFLVFQTIFKNGNQTTHLVFQYFFYKWNIGYVGNPNKWILIYKLTAKILLLKSNPLDFF